jgi:glycosyltransferase involved in cell wall biosynthesis
MSKQPVEAILTRQSPSWSPSAAPVVPPAGPKILFSHPVTLHLDVPMPAGSRFAGREAEDVRAFGHRYGPGLGELLLGGAYAWRLWRQGGPFDVLVTGRCGQVYAALRGLLPGSCKPHVLLGVEWLHRHRRWWRRLISVWDHRLIARGAWKIQVFCESEAADYANYYGIDRNKFVWIPYCTDVDDRRYPADEGDYVFSGGTQDRDYDTLFRAVDGLPAEVRVAVRADRVTAGRLPANVRLLGRLSKDDFWTALAGARVVVLSLDPDVMRRPGVITYVTAMRLGKCVVVNDPRGARSYVADGKTGLMVPARDPAALRAALRRVLDDGGLRRRLGASARDFAAEHFAPGRYAADLATLLRRWRIDR